MQLNDSTNTAAEQWSLGLSTAEHHLDAASYLLSGNKCSDAIVRDGPVWTYFCNSRR